MAGAPRAWMPRERWDALVRGEGCPLCADVAAPGADDAHGHFVADLGASRLRLGREQHVPGYCVLIARRHVREPYELDAGERAAYFEDLMRVGAALERVYRADKLRYTRPAAGTRPGGVAAGVASSPGRRYSGGRRAGE